MIESKKCANCKHWVRTVSGEVLNKCLKGDLNLLLKKTCGGRSAFWGYCQFHEFDTDTKDKK